MVLSSSWQVFCTLLGLMCAERPVVLSLNGLTCSCRAPVRLSGLQGENLLFRPAVMLQAAAAHLTAEALMNVPRMLGSLELLLNPAGLLTSVSAGLEDLLGLPFAALVEASPAQVWHGLDTPNPIACMMRDPMSMMRAFMQLSRRMTL